MSTPLRYLVFLGYETILRDLFTHLLVPPAVVQELQHAKTPARVRTWMASPPAWVEIRQPVSHPDAALQPTFKGVWYAAVNFAPLVPLDTIPDQCRRPHRRSDDGP